MSSDMKPFEELGVKVAEALGDGPSEETVMMQRRDFLDQVAQSKRPVRYPWVVGIATAAVLAAVLGILFKMNTAEPLPFWIGSDRNVGAEGQWVRAESAALLPIRFQGGSEVSLSSNAAARIISATSDDVRIDLASGKVNCSINGNHHTTWQVAAGPYTVHVTGTVFTTEWDPTHSKLDVAVSRGSVLVTGANLNAHGVQLAVGDHLRVDGEKALIALNPETEAAVETTEVETSPESAVMDVEPEITDITPEDRETVPPKAAPIPKMRESTRKNDAVEDTVKDATLNDEDTLDKMLATGDVESLWQIAMQARYNRNGGTAKTVLLTIRDRFKDSKRAETAAFVLGRVYQELQGSPRTAAGWFRRYLDESPNGPLAEEALGRLFDAYDKAGNTASAARYAEQYLSLYPSGLFADSARQVLKN